MQICDMNELQSLLIVVGVTAILLAAIFIAYLKNKKEGLKQRAPRWAIFLIGIVIIGLVIIPAFFDRENLRGGFLFLGLFLAVSIFWSILLYRICFRFCPSCKNTVFFLSFSEQKVCPNCKKPMKN